MFAPLGISPSTVTSESFLPLFAASSKCDAVLMESGHHHPWEVCAKWKQDNCNIGKVIFMHHGRDYINLPTQTAVASRRAWGGNVIFAEDDMRIEL